MGGREQLRGVFGRRVGQRGARLWHTVSVLGKAAELMTADAPDCCVI